MDFSWISQPETWIAFLTLVALELVLGVDNVIFISILAGKLPAQDQQRARTTGIALAVITRVLLLFSLSWIINLTEPLFSVPWFGGETINISGRDLILLAGGLFLIWKSTREIHDKLEGTEGHASAKVNATFANVIFQILLLDVVFSLDSVITAVGMVDELVIMIVAVIAAALVMIFTAGPIAKFVEEHPTIKILALSFLLLIGFTLVVEGFHQHIPKGYIYFAMGFSVLVEVLNLRVRQKAVQPVHLRAAYTPENEELKKKNSGLITELKKKQGISASRKDNINKLKKNNQLIDHKAELIQSPSSVKTDDLKEKKEIILTQNIQTNLDLSSNSRPLRAFICHAAQDKNLVRGLYKRLNSENWIDPWLDEEKLMPGQDWDLEIYKSIRSADIILVCLSSNSIAKEGYVQKEFKRALDLAEEKPEGSIYIIPLRLDECDPPFRFKKWQWLDYYKKDSHNKLLQSLRTLEVKSNP